MDQVLIALPSGSGVVPIMMVQSLLQLQKPVPCGFMSVERQRVDKARNAMVLETLKQGFSHILFVDDDNPIPPNTLTTLLSDDKDIVGAPILGRNKNAAGVYPLCCFYAEEVDVDGGKLKLYKNIEKFRENGNLHRVDAIGTGCLLIKRKVLETLQEKYPDGVFEFGDIKFKEPIIVDGNEYKRRTMSEDAEFSERATNAGFEIWVDDRIRPIHLTSQGFVQYGIRN